MTQKDIAHGVAGNYFYYFMPVLLWWQDGFCAAAPVSV